MEHKGKQILIIDDEEDLCEILQYNLGAEGFETDIAYSAEEAIKKNLVEYDLILLDIMMGAMSGFELADKIRNDLKFETPIIFLTAKDTENDILKGFKLGADDYIAKPFSINQLIARVNAVLKRIHSDKIKTTTILQFGEITIDTIKKRLIIHDQKIELTKTEYKLLKLLIDGQGKVYSREDLLRMIWGNNIVVNDRTVDVNITRLRNKLGDFGKYLKNKSGFGYFLES